MARPTIGHTAPVALLDAPVLDRDGAPAPLRSHFVGHAALIVFLRHFGCPGCTQQNVELRRILPTLDRLGVRCVLVANGAPAFIAGFAERHGLSDRRVTLVTDPTLRAFAAAGLLRSAWGVYGPRALVGWARTLASGIRGEAGSGDDTQQGGVVLVDDRSRVVFHHASATMTDLADPGDLMDAVLAMIAHADDARRAVV